MLEALAEAGMPHESSIFVPISGEGTAVPRTVVSARGAAMAPNTAQNTSMCAPCSRTSPRSSRAVMSAGFSSGPVLARDLAERAMYWLTSPGPQIIRVVGDPAELRATVSPGRLIGPRRARWKADMPPRFRVDVAAIADDQRADAETGARAPARNRSDRGWLPAGGRVDACRRSASSSQRRSLRGHRRV